MKPKQTYPFYIKTPMILLGLYLFFYFLYLLQDAFKPIAFAVIIAILTQSIVQKTIKFPDTSFGGYFSNYFVGKYRNFIT